MRLRIRGAPFAQNLHDALHGFFIRVVSNADGKKGVGTENRTNDLLLIRAIVKRREDRDISGEAKRLGNGDEFVRKKIIGPGELHLPAFVEKPALHKLRYVRPPLQPNRGSGMAESKNALLLRAVLALRGSR